MKLWRLCDLLAVPRPSRDSYLFQSLKLRKFSLGSLQRRCKNIALKIVIWFINTEKWPTELDKWWNHTETAGNFLHSSQQLVRMTFQHYFLCALKFLKLSLKEKPFLWSCYCKTCTTCTYLAFINLLLHKK